MCGFMCSEGKSFNFFMQVVAGFWNFYGIRKSTRSSLVSVSCVLHSWCAIRHFYKSNGKKAMQSGCTIKYTDVYILFLDNSLTSFPHSAFEWHI